MSKDWKKVFKNQPPVPYSIVGNMKGNEEFDENAVLFFEEVGALANELRLYRINDFKDGRNTLVIPSEVNGKPVVEVGEYAFHAQKIKNVYVPKSVKYIDKGAFCNESFNTFVVDGVETIGERAFNTSSFKNLVLLEGIKEIEKNAFWHSPETLEFPNSLEVIGESAFEITPELKSIKFGNGLMTIGSNAFANCYNLESLEFPDSLVFIEKEAFAHCDKLKTVKFGKGLRWIDMRAFKGCDHIEELDFGDAPVSVSVDAFSGCSKLRKVTIGKNCRYIGRSFDGCYGIIEVCNKSKFEIVIDEMPEDIDVLPEKQSILKGRKIYFPTVKNVCKDEKDSKLKKDGDFVIYDDGESRILVSYEGDDECVEIPYGVTDIWQYAFFDNHWIEEVIFPESVKTIGLSAFNCCRRLKNVELCYKVQDVMNEDEYWDVAQLETICDYAFANCGLESVEIPDSVKHVGKCAFLCNERLKEVVWGGSRNVLVRTFEGCKSLERVKLSPFVQFVDDYALEECRSLEKITLPHSIVRVSPTAFWKSKTLTLKEDGTLYPTIDLPECRLADVLKDHDNK